MQEDCQNAHVGSHGKSPGNPVANKLVEELAFQEVSHDRRRRAIQKVQLVVPLHNEAANIRTMVIEVLAALKDNSYSPTLLLVDDGSTDGSKEIIADLSVRFPEISYVSFSRNFGKEAAIIAGLIECDDDFDVLAYMDSDGQHTAADLIRLVREAESSRADVICGVRTDREYQTKLQRTLTKAFYRVFHFLSEQRIEEGVGDFNVLRPKVVKALRGLDEERPFMKGLVSWVGFKKKLVPITVKPRSGGAAKSSTKKMLKLALGAILSFSSWPLRAWSIIGATSAGIAFLYLLFVVASTAIWGRDVPGYATIIVLSLGLGGLQLLSVGILGEYVARIYDASKNRPRYIIAEKSF